MADFFTRTHQLRRSTTPWKKCDLTPALRRTISSNHLAYSIGRICKTSTSMRRCIRPKTSMRRCNRPSPASPTHVPLSRLQFLAANSSPSSRSNCFPSRDMAHQLESARFRALFESALQAYQKKTGVSLAQHPLAIKLQSCDTIEAITGLFQDQAQAFRDLQGSDKIMKSLKTTVSILSKFSSAASLADPCGLVRQKGIMACLTSLNFIHRHSHLPRRYRLVSLSYLTYVPFSSSYVNDLVTSV